jgi:hypothetical protein
MCRLTRGGRADAALRKAPISQQSPSFQKNKVVSLGVGSPHMTVVLLLTDGTTTKLQIDEILSCRLLFVLAKLTKLAIISVLSKAGNRRGRSTTRR